MVELMVSKLALHFSGATQFPVASGKRTKHPRGMLMDHTYADHELCHTPLNELKAR
jgi:hypothetical protein